MLEFFLILFSSIFSSTIAYHFLGGSFTYRHIPQLSNNRNLIPILIELRFHISSHYFLCTSEQINNHFIVYLIGENVPYDIITQKYHWFQTTAIQNNPKFYDIHCLTNYNNSACDNFAEKTWAYCESANKHSGYSILRRQFILSVQTYRPIYLEYSACCWANSSDKHFYFNLSITTVPDRNNSSPYPHIPASYYVDVKQPREIQIFAYDADDDEIICKRYEDDLKGFLTVHVDKHCQLIYQTNRVGKQFGQFWIMDRRNNNILSSSLISIQVNVLENIICHDQPEIFIKTNQNHNIKITQSIYLSVSLKPNCLSIQPQDQTITELTTLCTNNQPVVLANGGIEVLFQCTPYLCEKYQVCFIGEFSLRLPSTKIECFLIYVNGTESQCANAAKTYDFLKPRNRQFVMLDPTKNTITEKVSTNLSVLSPSKSSKKSVKVIPLGKSHSRRLLWIIIALSFCFLVGSIGYFGFKRIRSMFYSKSSKGNDSQESTRDGSPATIDSNTTSTYPDTKPINTSIMPHDRPKNSPVIFKVRSQHLRLGLSEDD